MASGVTVPEELWRSPGQQEAETFLPLLCCMVSWRAVIAFTLELCPLVERAPAGKHRASGHGKGEVQELHWQGAQGARWAEGTRGRLKVSQRLQEGQKGDALDEQQHGHWRA